MNEQISFIFRRINMLPRFNNYSAGLFKPDRWYLPSGKPVSFWQEAREDVEWKDFTHMVDVRIPQRYLLHILRKQNLQPFTHTWCLDFNNLVSSAERSDLNFARQEREAVSNKSKPNQLISACQCHCSQFKLRIKTRFRQFRSEFV